MQFEAVTPAHSTFPILRKTCKYLVEITPYIMTYWDHGTVDKCYSRTFAKGIKLHKHHHPEENTWHELHETIVGYSIGKLLLELSPDAVEMVLLEVTVCTEMIAYKNCHNLAFRKTTFTVSITFSFTVMGRQKKVVFEFGIQIFVKFGYNTEYFSNFVFGNHRFNFVCNLLIITYKGANNKRDYQLFKNFSYPELA